MRRIKNTLEHLLKFKDLMGNDALLTDFDYELIKGTIDHLDIIQKEFKQSFFRELSQYNPELFNTHTAKGKEFINRYHKYMSDDFMNSDIITNAFEDIDPKSEERINNIVQEIEEIHPQHKLDL